MGLLKTVSTALSKFHGWELIGIPVPPEAQRCVFVFAPHTSNWDWYFGTITMYAWGLPMKVAIKDIWLKFPFNLVIKPLGGIAIDRSQTKGLSQVEKLASLFKTNDKISFVITPEGSRKRRVRWKTGFFHIAENAQVPIVMLKANFKNRTVEFGPVLHTSDGIDNVMTSMMNFYRNCGPIYPELFALDERWS